MKGDTFKPSEAPDEEAKARRAKNLLALKKKERGLDWGADEGAPRAAALSRAHSTHTLPALCVERGAFCAAPGCRAAEPAPSPAHAR